MQSRVYPPLVEAFLILDQPRQRLGHWTQAVAALDDGRAPPLASVMAYYDPTTDQALLRLSYDELALGRERLAFVIEVALLAEIGMIQPAELSEGDRRRFLGERLERCAVQITDRRTVAAALSELVRRVRELRATGGIAAVTMSPRAASPDDPVLLVQPRSTRDNVVQPRSTMDFGGDDNPPPGAGGTPGPTPIRLAGASTPPPRRMTSPHVVPRSVVAPPAEVICARYLRSDRWVAARIGALSLKGVALMAGALPRLHDHADIVLTYGDKRALVRGPVTKLSSGDEVAQTGASTFSVAFELDDQGRRELTELLTAARAAQVTIQPPPARSARRYPVQWPVCLGTARGAIRCDALDLSLDGMFVRPVHALTLDATLGFSVALDDGGPPVNGRAQVVRKIEEVEARAAEMLAGYGLRIAEMAATDIGRWTQFLHRIERRAEKRVLVGASPDRLPALQAALAGVGYAVTCNTDPDAFLEQVNADRLVDAVLLDGGWVTPGTSLAWIESQFSARNVPCVITHGDAIRGRLAIDKYLV
jgi:hypothetical protein